MSDGVSMWWISMCGISIEVGIRLEVGLVVVGDLLVQDRADSLGDSAADLAFDDGGVDELAAVLDHHVAGDGHKAGLEVDLDPADVGGHGPAALAPVEVVVACQHALLWWALRFGGPSCFGGHVRKRHRDSRDPGHMDGAIGYLEVVHVSFEQVGGTVQNLGP